MTLDQFRRLALGIGLVVAAGVAAKLFQGMRLGWYSYVALGAVAAWLLLRLTRRDRLMFRYNDSEVVSRIMRGEIWLGQSVEQLLESRGRPQSIDRATLREEGKEIWKYRYRAAHKYGLLVVLKNGVVVSWGEPA